MDTLSPVTEVMPGIYQIRLPMTDHALRYVNSYLIIGDGGHALVDCGWDTPEVLDALEHALGRLRLRVSDIRQLIVTHLHTDHYGLAGTLRKLANVRLLMHRLDWEFIRTELADFSAASRSMETWLKSNGLPEGLWAEAEQRSMNNFRRFSLAAPDGELEDGDLIQVGAHRLQVIWTPGHTGGHICLYDATRRILFSGDHVLNPITPHISVSGPRDDNPLGTYLQSLRKLDALSVDLVLPAHREPFQGLTTRVEELVDHHAKRGAEALRGLANGATTAAQVAESLTWTRRGTTFAELGSWAQRLALTETLAHLEELRASGRVSRISRHGLLYYEKAT